MLFVHRHIYTVHSTVMMEEYDYFRAVLEFFLLFIHSGQEVFSTIQFVQFTIIIKRVPIACSALLVMYV